MKGLAWIALLLMIAPALADEGMWTFDRFPREKVKARYGVEISDAWLRNVQQSITRHDGGCTGSVVSGEGLVLTNQHCVMRCLAALSDSANDYIRDGFMTADRAGERRCPGELISILMETEDVTARVKAATEGLDPASANEARRQEFARLQGLCNQGSRPGPEGGGLACEAVSLYEGGQYFLYKYRRYTDVRMVFAPHHAIAAFGGDPDNFRFPRWALDFALVRLYEGDAPVRSSHHLKVRPEGAAAGEPVFVAGHPGSTSRLLTSAQLAFQRDTLVPEVLGRYLELRGRLLEWGRSGEEQRRIEQEPAQEVENSLKIYLGLQRALFEDRLFADKVTLEIPLRARLAGTDPDPWRQVDEAMARHRQLYDRYSWLESIAGLDSRLFTNARHLVRAAAERPKASGQRLREYADANLARVSRSVLAPVPVRPDYERLMLAFFLNRLREALGPDDALVLRVLGPETPESLAQKLVTGTSLGDAQARRTLWEQGGPAIESSQDPMIRFAREIDADARAVRRAFQDDVQAPLAAAQQRIAAARFATYGTGLYPDATFTLRLSYGAVKGWTEKGVEIAPFSRLERLYERTTGQEPFALPSIWINARARLDSATPFNLVTTNDVVGGNSGSPLIDAHGALVGLVFDGNTESIAGSFWYDERANRTIAVHPAMIATALSEVYGRDALSREIFGRTSRRALTDNRSKDTR